LGFFLGGVLLETLGFQLALIAMAAALTLVLVGVSMSLPAFMGKAKPSQSAREFFGKSRGVNLLAAARVALFGARDVWFVVGLPVFLYANGWVFSSVGAFLAIWTILYGAVQAAAPAITARSADGLSKEVPAARLWSFLLALAPLGILGALVAEFPDPDIAVAAGLLVFGFAFAVNSSLHSYLVLAYAGSEKAAEDVGFYYAANAAGRFMGTALSGLLYQWGGLELCLAAAAALLAVCWLVSLAFPSAASSQI
jgi:predicted MFS family arabinose efflux permease